jgi:MFS family permease
MIGYLAFLRAHWKHLLFGVLLMALSSFGQTFFISLFGADLRSTYHLSDAGLGAAYAAATFGSALTLQWVGRWIDRTTVARYTIGVAILLAGACALMAVSRSLPLLVGTLYLLRLGGQGLMVHTSLTAIARAFPGQRGKALGISNLGMPAAEAVLPLSVALGMAAIGWRGVWVGGVVVILVGTLLALACLPRQPGVMAVVQSPPRGHTERPRGQRLWRDPRVLFTLPAILAAPFISTGFFFHQARLLQEKGWAFDWWASCFVGYAVARAVSMVTVGPLIDRLGAVRVLPFFLAPLALSMAALAFVRQPWGVPLYLVPTGISGGISATLLTALWVELYGPERLAEVRSSVEAANVIASGTSPIIMGYLIDAGVPLSAQAACCLAYIVAASWIARRVEGLVLMAHARL